MNIMMELPLKVDFTGKVVVVTGAGGGLCGTMARAFAQAGAKVAALNRSTAAIEKMEQECAAEGLVCKAYKANVLDVEELTEVHRRVLADLGPCDILINGAGGNNPKATTDNEYQHEAKEGHKTFFDLEPDGVDAVFRLNFQGTLLPTQIFARDMVERKSGCILNISSMNAYTPGPRPRSPTLHNGWRPISRGQGSAATPLRRGSCCPTRTAPCCSTRTGPPLPGPKRFSAARR